MYQQAKQWNSSPHLQDLFTQLAHKKGFPPYSEPKKLVNTIPYIEAEEVCWFSLFVYSVSHTTEDRVFRFGFVSCLCVW